MNNNKIGEIIRKYRKMAGFNQDDAAHLLNTSRSTYIRYEKGERTPTIDMLMDISKLYEVRLYDLIAPLEAEQPGERKPLPQNRSNINDSCMLPAKFNQLTDIEKGYIIKLMDILIANR